MKKNSVSIVLFGLGAIGRMLARTAWSREDLHIVGAVDSDPKLVGQSLPSLWRSSSKGPRIVPDLGQIPGRGRRRTLVHASGSHLSTVIPQIEPALKAGYNVVTSCEEMSWPWNTHPVLARRLDRLARRHRVAVLGTGVNPGFLLDLLPLVLTGICCDVSHVLAVRVVDAATRRKPLQRKVGAGLTPAQFRRLTRTGKLGHVGLVESAWMIAAGMGWSPDRVTNRVQPVLSAGVRTGKNRLRSGEVAGLRQVVVARERNREIIRLDLTMAMGAPDPHDRIKIRAVPPLSLRMEPGVPGDAATIAALLTGVAAIQAARPGLRTVLDLPPRPSGKV